MRHHFPDRRSLLRVIRDASAVTRFDPHELARCLDAAADARLTGWFLTRLEEADIPSLAPPWLKQRIDDARATASEAERGINWEINRLQRAFLETDIRWVLLKGAGYVAARLPPGRGRQVADIDILVPAAALHAAEEVLRRHRWDSVPIDDYDDRYYREWAHELPPMIHADRRTVVDLHHGILQRTSRRRPSPARLIERAVAVGGVRTLCPSHMVLHAAAHLFHDGEVAGAIRDLVDIDGLVREFARDSTFWSDWLSEARQLDLERPAFYALRYANQITGTPIPKEVQLEMVSWAPPRPVLSAMDVLVRRTLAGRPGPRGSLSAFALYVRSHWLRMPPSLLVQHLTRKAFRRRK